MSQLSFFSAEARERTVSDLAGLLCGPGQLVRFGASDTARLSVVLPDRRRAPALVAEAALRGVVTEVGETDSGSAVLRTAFRADLVEIAARWRRGAVKCVPAGFDIDGPTLRLWLLCAGHRDRRDGLLLGLDPHAESTHPALAAALGRAGLPALRLGPRGGGPALRVSGARRLRRLAEMIGPPPKPNPGIDWPL